VVNSSLLSLVAGALFQYVRPNSGYCYRANHPLQWKILASAAKFLAFLGGYTIFLGPMTSILITDYYIVRRGNVSVPDMYNFHGMYRYHPRYASNWRAVAAFFIGCIPPLPGFVNSIVAAGNGKTSVTLGGQHM
jgi:NCS1 family nucleobase:cation symporter-1